MMAALWVRATGFVLLVILLTCSGVWAKEVTFVFDHPYHQDTLSFKAHIPFNDFVGQTHQITGFVSYDDSLIFDEKHPCHVQLKVNLDSLATGFKPRDNDMKEDYLQTNKYPNALFDTSQMKMLKKPESQGPIQDGQSLWLEAIGPLQLHGRSVPMSIPVKVTYYKESTSTHTHFPTGDIIHVQATFPLDITNFGISQPQIAFYKMDKQIVVTLDAYGHKEK